MSTELNKQFVVRWKAKRNEGNANFADDLCAPDIVLHMSGLPIPGPVRGREAFTHLFAAYLTAFAFHSLAEILIAGGPLAGTPWRDLPERYGAWQTCADRLYRWRREGLWDRILTYVQTKLDAVGEVV